MLVPFAEHGETEQRARAQRLRELGLAIVVEDPGFRGLRSPRAIDDAAAKEEWGRWTFDCDGAERSAELVVRMLERRSESERTHDS